MLSHAELSLTWTERGRENFDSCVHSSKMGRLEEEKLLGSGTDGAAASLARRKQALETAQRPGSWELPQEGGGAAIAGRQYSEHALERMAPRTNTNNPNLELFHTLERRAYARAEAAGFRPGTPEFVEWWGHNGPNPRGIPPSVVENAIQTGVRTPGNTPGTFVHTDSVNGLRIITNERGHVVTALRGND